MLAGCYVTKCVEILDIIFSSVLGRAAFDEIKSKSKLSKANIGSLDRKYQLL